MMTDPTGGAVWLRDYAERIEKQIERECLLRECPACKAQLAEPCKAESGAELAPGIYHPERIGGAMKELRDRTEGNLTP